MRNKIYSSVILAVVLFGFAFLPSVASAQADESQQDEFVRAVVLRVEEEQREINENGSESIRQKLSIEITHGPRKGQKVVHNGLDYDVLSATRYEAGDRVIAVRTVNIDGRESYYVVEHERSRVLLWLLVLFAALVILVGRSKGLRAVIVLVLTLLIILKFIIPQILNGHNPLVVGLLGSVVILLVAIYLTEGVNRRSHIAIAAIALSLLVTGLLSLWFVDWLRLSGFDSEDVMYLVASSYGAINVKGLLLAGVIIGALGVIDDVVVAQVALVEQLKKTDAQLSAKQIYRKSMKVGVSHLSSMVNTLFLAYAGASLPLLLLFGVNDLAPLGFVQIVSNEMIATEIMRSLVGSMGLVLAVPISTLLAVRFVRA
jgi:uncharacterized membrane protein